MKPDLPPVRMDFVLIVQVLVNVLDNALKYSPHEAVVTVEAHLAAGSLIVRISDEGDGIPEPDLSRVFEKFNRARRTGETGGIGLGLSICKGLIEAHHGRIWAERQIPAGRRSRLRYRCAPRRTAGDGGRDRPPHPHRG